jgi:ABC-type uncharacterized transport system substrate-binding protein
MNRRVFLSAVTGGLLIAPLVAEAQPATVARIDLLSSGSLNSPEAQVMLNAFQQELRALGYIQGQNIVGEYREAEGEMGRLPSLASDLARLKVDLIVAAATPAARAARRATSTLPIVAVAMGDPIADGSSRASRALAGMSQETPSLAQSSSPSAWNYSRKRFPAFPEWLPSGIPALTASAR